MSPLLETYKLVGLLLLVIIPTVGSIFLVYGAYRIATTGGKPKVVRPGSKPRLRTRLNQIKERVSHG